MSSPNPEIMVNAVPGDPFGQSIVLTAPELGAKCGVHTDTQAVADLFVQLVHGVINGDAFIAAMIAVNSEFAQVAGLIAKACLGVAS